LNHLVDSTESRRNWVDNLFRFLEEHSTSRNRTIVLMIITFLTLKTNDSICHFYYSIYRLLLNPIQIHQKYVIENQFSKWIDNPNQIKLFFWKRNRRSMFHPFLCFPPPLLENTFTWVSNQFVTCHCNGEPSVFLLQNFLLHKI